MYSNNIFLSTYNHLNDLVDKCINEHKNHKYPGGIICDTRYIAEITHKRHDHVLRDIDELIILLNNQGRRTFREVAKTEAVAENHTQSGEVAIFGEHTKITQRINKDSSKKVREKINMKYEFRIIETSYYDDRGNIQRAYQ